MYKSFLYILALPFHNYWLHLGTRDSDVAGGNGSSAKKAKVGNKTNSSANSGSNAVSEAVEVLRSSTEESRSRTVEEKGIKNFFG